MFRSIIGFETHPGREQEFETAFRDCGMLTRPRAIPGFISVELLRAADDSNRYAVIGLWQTRDAYAHWQSVSQSGAPREALRRLSAALVKVEPGRLFAAVPEQGL